MPNWCWCNLTVKGDKVDLDRFKQVAEHDGKVLSEESFLPYPEHFKLLDTYCQRGWDARQEKWVYSDLTQLPDEIKHKLIELAIRGADLKRDGFNQGGYEWCVSVWGTKWGFCEPERRYVEDGLLYTFTSAWNPPYGLLEKMAQDFPLLGFDLDYEVEGDAPHYSISYGRDRSECEGDDRAVDIQRDSIGATGEAVCPFCDGAMTLSSDLIEQSHCECPICSRGIDIV